MERQGINLTANHVIRWQARSIKNIAYLFSVILFAGISAGILHFYAWQNIHKNRPLITENRQLQSRLNGLEHQIASLKNSRQSKNIPTIDTDAVTAFTQLISRLPLNQGGVEFIRIYNEQEPSLKIAGTLKRQPDFKRLEDYLHAFENITVTIEHFQINENNNVEFGLLIQWEKK